MASVTSSIVAVGTELTSGQTTNRNAAWLAQQLEDLGVTSPWHVTVPDDRELIRDALELAATRTDWIFITGGLGPTTDDFTRDVVAEFLGAPLEFHAESWTRIETRLQSAGIPVAPSNRQQCYYPRGAEVLVNHSGTASGFAASWQRGTRSGRIFVLPGPPREISAIWDTGGLRTQLQRLAPARAPTRLYSWQCLGVSESALGEIVEAAVAGAGVATGYRAHRPYIEVKVWAPEPLTAAAQAGLAKLEAAIQEWTVTRGNEDLAAAFWHSRPPGQHVWLADHASQGLLGERLSAGLRQGNLPLQFSVSLQPAPADALQIELHAAPGWTQWELMVREPGKPEYRQSFAGTIRVPTDNPDRAAFLDRALRYGAEKALVLLHRQQCRA